MGENKVPILPALEGDKTVLTQCVRTLSQTFAALLKLFGQYWINMVHSTVCRPVHINNITTIFEDPFWRHKIQTSGHRYLSYY